MANGNSTTPQTQPQAAAAGPGAGATRQGFPDPSLTLIEFSDHLGLLMAERTERDETNRRLVLRKVAYIRVGAEGTGVVALPEVWIQQTREGIFAAVDPASGQVFRFPSRLRYEVAFISRALFEATLQCLKSRSTAAINDLIVVNFSGRSGFTVEAGCLVGPDDYAAENVQEPPKGWVPFPSLL
jgi:hypothetical protein